MCCCNTAPTAVSEASVIRHVGASRVAFARASLVALKAARVSSVQGSCSVLVVEESSASSSPRSEAEIGGRSLPIQ